jgi:uncharacterized caspase-like protein
MSHAPAGKRPDMPSHNNMSIATAFVHPLRFALFLLVSAAIACTATAADRAVQKGGADGRRVALVIGNGSYKDAPLKNPANDATDMAAALKGLGFEVIARTNASQREMKGAVREFGQKLRGAETGLFFFAGHGLQVKGINYLVPVAVDIESEADAEDQAVSLDYVMRTMEEGGAKFNVAILDACRNNPFARSFRSGARGLANAQAASGSFIAYATAPGSVAADGDGRNGLYTRHLLKNLAQGDSDILKVFQRVRTGVVGDSAGKQTPWESTSLVGEFYFRAGQGVQVASLTPVPAAPTGGGLSLDDIHRQQQTRAQWDKWQAQMQADFDKVAALDAAPDLQTAAWDRFLAAYTQKNPLGDRDEQLRSEARSRKAKAEADKQRRTAQETNRRVLVVSGFAGEPDPARTVAEIVAADLRRSDLMRITTVSQTISEQERPDIASLASTGATYLLAGSVKREGDGRLDVRFRLWDLRDGKELGGQSFRVIATDLRLAGHRISDRVQERATGVPGTHAKRVARIEVRDARHVLLVEDSDGHRGQTALTSPKALLMPTWSPGGDTHLGYFSFEHGAPVLFVQEVLTGKRTRTDAPDVSGACASDLADFPSADAEHRRKWLAQTWIDDKSGCAEAMARFMARNTGPGRP